MIAVASNTTRSPSTSSGKRLTGHSSAHSRAASGSSSIRYSNGMAFSYSAISAFCEYDENGCA